MHHYAAWEIIRQRTGEMRAQARRDEAARQARHNRDARSPKEAGRPGNADRDQDAGAEVIPMPRVPDYVDGTFRDAGPSSHAC
jgi:hypothetical protein